MIFLKKILTFDFSNWRLMSQSITSVIYSNLLQNVKHVILFFASHDSSA